MEVNGSGMSKQWQKVDSIRKGTVFFVFNDVLADLHRAKKVLVRCRARDTIIEKARYGCGPDFIREIPVR